MGMSDSELKQRIKANRELQKQEAIELPLPRHKQRFEKIPAGFVRYRGKNCPYPDDARVEFVIRTAEGYGIAGPSRADHHDWKLPSSELGSIAASRLVPLNDLVAIEAKAAK
jgi:hypothetical protein